MNEYYFLFLVALLWTVFASVQDIRKREVANWLNFSFLAVVLAYRAFYSIFSGKYEFLLYGLIGAAVFFLFSEVFYYMGIFGGGDARLLRAFGVILPYAGFKSLIFSSLGFLFLLFFIGAVYTLIYSLFLVFGNYKKFKNSFLNLLMANKNLLIAMLAIELIILMMSVYATLFLFFIISVYFYLKAVEKSCLIVKLPAGKLSEGDWLFEDVKVGNKWVRTSVHGLSFKDISLLRKYKKRVFIKKGIPFVPVFLISLLVMVFFYLFLSDYQKFFAFLF